MKSGYEEQLAAAIISQQAKLREHCDRVGPGHCYTFSNGIEEVIRVANHINSSKTNSESDIRPELCRLFLEDYEHELAKIITPAWIPSAFIGYLTIAYGISSGFEVLHATIIMRLRHQEPPEDIVSSILDWLTCHDYIHNAGIMTKGELSVLLFTLGCALAGPTGGTGSSSEGIRSISMNSRILEIMWQNDLRPLVLDR